MTMEPEINTEATRERARVLFGAIVVLLHVDEPEAVIVALDQELQDAFTEGFYAGVEAWDLVHSPKAGNADIPPAE